MAGTPVPSATSAQQSGPFDLRTSARQLGFPGGLNVRSRRLAGLETVRLMMAVGMSVPPSSGGPSSVAGASGSARSSLPWSVALKLHGPDHVRAGGQRFAQCRHRRSYARGR